MNEYYAFCLGFIAAFILHIYANYTYKKILVSKAKGDGQVSPVRPGNTEFIFGKPYVIIPEEEYCDLFIKGLSK